MPLNSSITELKAYLFKVSLLMCSFLLIITGEFIKLSPIRKPYMLSNMGVFHRMVTIDERYNGYTSSFKSARGTAARSFTQLDEIYTVNFRATLQVVFAPAKLLHCHGHTLFDIVLSQIFGCFYSPLFKHFTVKHTPLDKELHHCL